MNRAYSLIEVKALDADRRTFKGWATTPAVDRVGDTIDPMGARFTNPLALLHQHRHDAPIGSVRFSKPTPKGIEFEAEIPVIDEPGPLKDRVDTAWGEIKAGLVRAVSIGFRPIKYAFRDDGGVDYQEIEIYELSAVTIPAQAEAVITSAKAHEPATLAVIKQFDTGAPVETARPTPPDIRDEPKDKAAPGPAVRVVRLDDPACDRAQPFVIRQIKRPR